MLYHKGTVYIETDRLILRKFEKEDAGDMFTNWANDPDVTKYLSWNVHKKISITREIINTWVYSYKKTDFYNWAIVFKSDAKVIGSISLDNISNVHFRCEIGYCLSKVFWNRGLMTEALKSVVKYLFTDVGFKRIQAIHHTANYASGKVMLKAGMKYEGILRKYHLSNDGVLTDCKIYSIIDKDLLKQNSIL